MAETRDLGFSPPSPRSSSGGVDSFKGTPDTRLTAYSQDDASSQSSMPKDLGSSSTSSIHLPAHTFAAGPYPEKDPFMTSQSNLVSRLSPTASIFNPFGSVAGGVHSNPTSVLSTMLSTDLGLSRYLRISSSKSVSTTDVYTWFADSEAKGGATRRGTKSVSSHNGSVYVQFSDIRDAYSAHSSIRLTESSWVVNYIAPAQARKDDTVQIDHVATQTGQVWVSAGTLPGSVVDTVWAMEAVQIFLQKHGRLFAFVRRATFSDGSFRAIAEFCDNSVILPLLRNYDTAITIEGMHLLLTPGTLDSGRIFDLSHAFSDLTIWRDYAEQASQQHGRTAPVRPTLPPDAGDHSRLPMYPLMFRPPWASTMPFAFDPLPPQNHTASMGSLATTAAMSPHLSVIGALYQTPPSPPLTATNPYSPSKALTAVGRLDVRRQNAARINRSSYHNSVGHHNHVDTSRIREGTDVRTTIMLRNIPNKVDQAMLKRIVDDSSWGKYDFMYLRIDFANDCNVGYAFINFVDPLDIIDFVEARGNQRWNCFKSDKVAEISYATIQGKDCLVQKFRNSSVMLESPHYRPKLFFTSNGPIPERAGQEEPFPEPDNQSKMKRSCENAEHVGLFTPNAGQHFRDEQRRRRSQYDRGTRLAALEEYDYDTAIQHLYSGDAQ